MSGKFGNVVLSREQIRSLVGSNDAQAVRMVEKIISYVNEDRYLVGEVYIQPSGEASPETLYPEFTWTLRANTIPYGASTAAVWVRTE